jgi:hypothetical protein
MRIKKLTPIIVSLIVLAVITAILVRYRSVEAQEDRAAKAPIAAKAALQTQTEDSNGFTTVRRPDTTTESNADLVLDADEVEKRALAEQTASATAAAAATSLLPVSFKHVALPVRGGIDHAVAGVATRNSGNGVIRLRGVPPGSQLLSALLVWGEIAAGPFPNAVFGQDCAVPANVVGVTLPPAPQPCWNPAGQFFAYAANVTAQIAPGINGDYRVRVRSAIVNGQCPWGDGACPQANPALPLGEGASLIVIYANQCIDRRAQLFFHVGPQTFFFGFNSYINFTGIPILGLPSLKHSRIGGDGQVGTTNCGLRATPFLSDERTWIENVPFGAISTQIKGDVGGLNRDSDWNGYDGEPLNKLWDSHTDVFDNRLGGQVSYTVRYLSQGDCISWVVHILGVR